MSRFLLAVAILPAVYSAAIGAARSIAGAFLHFELTLPFLAGAAAYPLVHYSGRRSVRLYVLAHELSHAFAALLSGVRVRSISVGDGGGHVTLSGNSVFISLAPYCLPLYAFILALSYWASGLIWDMGRYRLFFLGGMGFFLAFHCVYTYETLAGQTQSDLKKAGGVFFSLSLIVLANSAVVLAALKMLFPAIVPVRRLVYGAFHNTVEFWEAAFAAAIHVYSAAVSLLGG